MKISGVNIGFLCLLCLLFCACEDEGGAACGNGVIETGEDCDVNMGGTTCGDLGYDRGLLACNEDCTYDESGCIDCGNDVAEEGEACDGTDLANKTCQDLGHIGGDLACSDDCTFDQSNCHDWRPLTIVVRDSSAGSVDPIPLQGATVALDAPSGERFEAVTDSEGKVTFADIDWTLGSTTVTAHLDGYSIVTIAAFDASVVEEDLVLYLYSLNPEQPETVTISGTLTGVVDLAHTCYVNVINTMVGTEWIGTGDQTWGIRVPRGQPFTIQGEESEDQYLPSGQGYQRTFYRVTHRDFDPIDVNTSGVVLDLADFQVQTYTADTWFSTPPRPDSPLRSAFPHCFACARNSRYCVGWPTYIDISADKSRFDASMLWTEPSWVEEPVISCQVANSQGLGSAVIYTNGYPQPGELNPLIDVPRWIAPANPTMAHPLHDPLEWELFDPDVNIQLNVYGLNQLVWVAYPGPNAESLTLPAPPSSVDPAALLGTQPLTSYLYAYYYDEAGENLMGYSLAQSILLAP